MVKSGLKPILWLLMAGVFPGVMMGAVPSGAGAQPLERERIEGLAAVVSAQAVRLGERTVLLGGMVVPELAKDAKRALEGILAGRIVQCTVLDQTQGSLPTALCLVDGVNISQLMVRSGNALAYEEGGLDFSSVQSVARLEGAGVWSVGDTALLARAAADGLAAGNVAPRDCLIKGNKSSTKPYGLKYHVPGSSYYSRTRIAPARGDKWFCSRAAAEAEGFVVSGS